MGNIGSHMDITSELEGHQAGIRNGTGRHHPFGKCTGLTSGQPAEPAQFCLILAIDLGIIMN
jgi:hypothetical protein